MIKVRLFTMLIVVCCAVIPVNVSQIAAQSQCPFKDGIFRIAWIPKALNNIVFEIGQTGAETKAAELSKAGPCRVEILVAAPLDPVADEQAQLLQKLIDQKNINAIGVSCIDPDACIAPINQAVEAGIPVMTWDSDSPKSKRFTYLGIDNYEAGKAAADLLVHFMGKAGKVAIISGVKGSLNLEQRVQGFKDGISQYPDIKIVTTLYGNDEPVESARLVEEFSKTTPTLTGWFMAGLWQFTVGRGAMPTWEKMTLDKSVVNISIDTLPIQLDLMREGFLQGLVGQKYWGWGYDTVQMLYDYVVNGAKFDSFVNSGLDIVTLNNVDAMTKAWDTKDFTQKLPPPFPTATSEAISSASQATAVASATPRK